MLPNTHSKCYIDLTEKHILYTLSASNQSVSKVKKYSQCKNGTTPSITDTRMCVWTILHTVFSV